MKCQTSNPSPRMLGPALTPCLSERSLPGPKECLLQEGSKATLRGKRDIPMLARSSRACGRDQVVRYLEWQPWFGVECRPGKYGRHDAVRPTAPKLLKRKFAERLAPNIAQRPRGTDRKS